MLEHPLTIAHKDLYRLILARDLLSQGTTRTCPNFWLPELVDLFWSR
ncbi:hypothetical protein JKG68_26005 [Microvirga aerilata]|uniref:Uncharacterized protein n=1 Tax=Microvirga aerilata TaxID=670292 RepID=A0A936ZC49_9HYPH|nr:hypothetical protein [Microvirga aerilata]MBL0407377.1 hypothetical protein [Microvirga aerilata]